MGDSRKTDLSSLDIAQDRREQLIEALKAVCPEAVREDHIDIDTLRRTLGDFVDAPKERFGLNWFGKAECMKVIQHKSIATLKPKPEESVNFDTTQNLIIEGDNLEVLKLLQNAYYGKVKMIYIDPPYNTGKEFIYPDKFAENLETYLAYTGQKDEEGRKFSTNSDRNGRYHANWLNMMYPRLFLARNLLRDDGVIFISIDDNEQANLKLICDELFGEENFIACFIWKSRQNIDNRSDNGASKDHEYILSYGRSIRGSYRDKSQYSNPDNDPRGNWASANMVGLASKSKRPNLHYDLINPETGINYGCPNMGWRYDRHTMSRLIKENCILWPQKDEGRPRRKVFISDIESDFTGFSTVIGSEIYTKNGTENLDKIFESRIFDFPKPMQLMHEIIEQALTKDNDIILDFFAGSGTTAHAVMQLNKEDGGNRKFILVQLPEKTDPDSEAYKAGYHTIAQLTRERVRRAGQKLLSNKELAFSNLDIGFKAFSLDRSNFKIWDETGETPIEEQLEMHLNPLLDDTKEQDLLYELILKQGFPLNAPLDILSIKNRRVYVIDNSLFICLDKDLDLTFIQALAELTPQKVLCLDEGFHQNDALLTNAVLIFRDKAREIEREIIFKTI